MRNNTANILAILTLMLALTSCKQNEVDGIVIGHTLYVNQSLSDNQELRKLIKQTLDRDERSLVKLKNFWCGGGAGCYDLGSIMTQIIYRMGETDFIVMVDKLEENEIRGIHGLINAGLEYGDNDKDGKMDQKKIEVEFPKLLKQIETK